MSEAGRELFFVQLCDTAPAISAILKTYPSRIHGKVSTGDAINNYGVSIVFQVFVEVLMDRCKTCGATSFTSLNIDNCRRHKFSKEWREVASGETDEGLLAALKRADKRAAEWLRRRKIAVKTSVPT